MLSHAPRDDLAGGLGGDRERRARRAGGAREEGPRWLELLLIAGYGVFVAVFMRGGELQLKPTKLEAAWRIGLAALQTAAAVACLTFAALVALAPARTEDGHPTQAMGHAALALLAFVVAGIATVVRLARARERDVLVTRVVLAFCAIATVISLVRDYVRDGW